jgi:cation:H+ antiporter
MEYQVVWLSVLLVVSLGVLVKGSDIFVDVAKKVGVIFGLSPFVIGVLIVGMGTSLPELASSIAAVFTNNTEIVIANVVGSNITNILLVVGILALLSKKIVIRKDLLQSELPLFAIATTHFFFIVSDGVVDRVEAGLLLGTCAAYLWYILKDSDEVGADEVKVERDWKTIYGLGFWLVLGLIAIIGGAHYTVYAAVDLAEMIGVPVSIVSILAIAVGTSLPELMVSLRAIKTGEVDMAVGNIFGSNAINMLLVVGVPALMTTLYADEVVMGVGLHILMASSVILLVHGLARKLMQWEGAMLLLFYAFFVVQLFKYI